MAESIPPKGWDHGEELEDWPMVRGGEGGCGRPSHNGTATLFTPPALLMGGGVSNPCLPFHPPKLRTKSPSFRSPPPASRSSEGFLSASKDSRKPHEGRPCTGPQARQHSRRFEGSGQDLGPGPRPPVGIGAKFVRPTRAFNLCPLHFLSVFPLRNNLVPPSFCVLKFGANKPLGVSAAHTN